MARKTQGVHDIAADVLGHMTPPYAEDIIEDVFLAIEMNPTWIRRYRVLEADLGQSVVKNWMGQYIKRITGMKTMREASATRATLIKSYSKLYYEKEQA
jgi:hypothetical protein